MAAASVPIRARANPQCLGALLPVWRYGDSARCGRKLNQALYRQRDFCERGTIVDSSVGWVTESGDSPVRRWTRTYGLTTETSLGAQVHGRWGVHHAACWCLHRHRRLSKGGVHVMCERWLDRRSASSAQGWTKQSEMSEDAKQREEALRVSGKQLNFFGTLLSAGRDRTDTPHLYAVEHLERSSTTSLLVGTLPRAPCRPSAPPRLGPPRRAPRT